MQGILANGKTPSATPTFRPALPKVEGLNDARTPLAGFFSILLMPLCQQGSKVYHGARNSLKFAENSVFVQYVIAIVRMVIMPE
jgi:hypothetical protein